MKGLVAERQLLMDDPVTVMNKVAYISGAAYWRFLGDRSINRAKRFVLHGWGYVRHRIRRAIATRTFPPFFFYTQYTVVMPDIIDSLCQFFEGKSGEKWMAFLHMMDVHDCRGFNRPLTVLARWRFLPRWWAGKFRGLTDRRFGYDTALMSVDASVGKLLDALERSGQADDLLFLVTGDHGSFYARSPRIQKGVIATRTHFEDIETPLVLGGAKPPPSGGGLIDSMGMTATLLDALGVEPHSSFKGKSAYTGGWEAIISESCGHGAADLARRDIHFTVTTKSHRMMAVLSWKKLSAVELYDIRADRKEMINLVSAPESLSVIADLFGHIHRERAELMALRGIEAAI